MKKIEVNISQCLSSTQEIEVPDNYEYDLITLEQFVKDQIVLPSDCLEINGYYDWYIDDFCVT